MVSPSEAAVIGWRCIKPAVPPQSGDADVSGPTMGQVIGEDAVQRMRELALSVDLSNARDLLTANGWTCVPPGDV